MTEKPKLLFLLGSVSVYFTLESSFVDISLLRQFFLFYLLVSMVTYILQDEGTINREDLPKDCFVVYQGMKILKAK
jgi:hypothetical protein